MPSFVIAGTSTTARTLVGAETGRVTPTGVLNVSGGVAIAITGATVPLVIDGQVRSSGIAIKSEFGAGAIEIGATGHVTSTGSDAVRFNAVTTNLTIAGRIDAAVTGIFGVGSGWIDIAETGVISSEGKGVVLTNVVDMEITNAGSILSEQDFSVQIIGASADFTNSGFVSQFVVANLTERFDLLNTGTIEGGLRLNNTGVTTIENRGVIRGGETMISGGFTNGIRFDNFGRLDGGTSLSDGVDFFNGVSGLQGNVSGMDGDDTLLGGVRGERMSGGDGFDLINGGMGWDTLLGDAGRDAVYGGDGNDEVRGGLGFDRLIGGDGDDALRGDEHNDTMFGGNGIDALFGGTGLDTLQGGPGRDHLNGGMQNDVLSGDLNNDDLTGGGGADVFVFAPGQGTDRITDFENNVDKLDLRAFNFASVAAVVALASASSQGLRIDVPGEGVVFVAGLTLAALNVTDLLL